MTEGASESRGLIFALGSYLTLLVLYMVAFIWTNVLVLFAKGLDTLSDVLISLFLLLALYWSRKPPDESHMFGHGRAQNVAALVAATIFISLISLELFREAIPKLFDPFVFEFHDTNLALIVAVVGMAVNTAPLVYLLRVRGRGASAKAQLFGLFSDEISYVAAIIGIILAGWGYYWADPVASMIIAAIIAVGGLQLFRLNFHYLVGRAPEMSLLEKVESTAKSVEGVLGIHDLRAEYIGPDIIYTGFHIVVDEDLSVREADRIAEEVKIRVHQETACELCVIHVDPADDSTEENPES